MSTAVHPQLEKVARALCVADWDQGEDNWRAYIIDARAAVQALMEPDRSQVIAGNVCLYDHLTVDAHDLPELSDGAAIAALQAMLRPLVEGEPLPQSEEKL